MTPDTIVSLLQAGASLEIQKSYTPQSAERFILAVHAEATLKLHVRYTPDTMLKFVNLAKSNVVFVIGE